MKVGAGEGVQGTGFFCWLEEIRYVLVGPLVLPD